MSVEHLKIGVPIDVATSFLLVLISFRVLECSRYPLVGCILDLLID